MEIVAYFAGHFDGEGCIRMQRHNKGYRLEVIVCASYHPVLERYKINFGGSIAPDRHSTNKQLWRWTLNTQLPLLAFLEAIEPYILEKRPQILLGITWLRKRFELKQNRVPNDFYLYSAACAQELSRMKKFNFPLP